VESVRPPVAVATSFRPGIGEDVGMADAPPPRPRFPWRATFHRSTTPLFVVGPTRRLRYANPAWEVLTGKPLANVRGMRLSALRSGSPLGQALAVPPEAWARSPTTVRRAVPPACDGPPWWDISFVPVMGDSRPLAVVGSIAPVGEPPARGGFRLPAAVGAIAGELAAAFGFDLLAGSSPLAERLVSQARHAAATTAPLWLVGEPGSGKRTVARVVHHHGPTRERAFWAVDGAGVPGYLLEMQLFGRGGLAYGGHLGTVYLADPAALPRDTQERLAHLFSVPRPKAARLICGAAAPAADLVAAGKLVPKFHTQLSTLEVRVPPLRDRPDDLPKLLDRLASRSGVGPASPDALALLRGYPWPGNLRELAAVLYDPGEGPLTADALPRRFREHQLAAEAVKPAAHPKLDAVLEAVERRLIQHALALADGNQQLAATRLGVPRPRLWRRAVALGLTKGPG
jgi:hypothetical protein